MRLPLLAAGHPGRAGDDDRLRGLGRVDGPGERGEDVAEARGGEGDGVEGLEERGAGGGERVEHVVGLARHGPARVARQRAARAPVGAVHDAPVRAIFELEILSRVVKIRFRLKHHL